MKPESAVSTKSLRAVFFARTRKTAAGCWEWTGSYGLFGYGRLNVASTTFAAHRFAYELMHGPIPAHLCVCHRCDNRSCVKPAHLFLGTPADNQADMVEKGRGRNGERNGRAILMPDDVREIRRLYTNGEGHTQHQLAYRFGVSQLTISNIVTRRTWRHI